MEYLHQCRDKQFALGCVDPPYSNAGHKIERTGGTWASKYGTKIKEWDIAPPPMSILLSCNELHPIR